MLPLEPDRGFGLLPERSPGDVWLDLEGDPGKNAFSENKTRRVAEILARKIAGGQVARFFRTWLEPLLERIHRSARHVGKSPRHAPATAARHAEVIELRRRLAAPA